MLENSTIQNREAVLAALEQADLLPNAYTKTESDSRYAVSTHVHSTTNEQVVYNSGGTLKGDANMTYTASEQRLYVGKVETTNGLVNAFRMKAADGTGTVYNVYISGGTMVVALP